MSERINIISVEFIGNKTWEVQGIDSHGDIYWSWMESEDLLWQKYE